MDVEGLPRRRRVLAGLPTPLAAHRAIVAFCTAMVVVLLLVDGLTTRTLGAAGTDAPSANAPLAGATPDGAAAF